MLGTFVEERKVYIISRQREVLCRLSYTVDLLREGMYRYFLVRVEELE